MGRRISVLFIGAAALFLNGCATGAKSPFDPLVKELQRSGGVLHPPHEAGQVAYVTLSANVSAGEEWFDRIYAEWCSKQGGTLTPAADVAAACSQKTPILACELANGDRLLANRTSVGTRAIFSVMHQISMYDAAGLAVKIEACNRQTQREAAAVERAQAFQARREAEQAEKRRSEAHFQANIAVGDRSDRGLIIEVKPPLALVQTCLGRVVSAEGERCSATNLEWVPITELRPAR